MTNSQVKRVSAVNSSLIMTGRRPVSLFFIAVLSNAKCISLSLKMKVIRLQRVKLHKVTSARAFYSFLPLIV